MNAIWLYLLNHCSEKDRNSEAVNKLLRASVSGRPDKTILDRVFDEVAEKEPESEALKAYREYKALTSKK